MCLLWQRATGAHTSSRRRRRQRSNAQVKPCKQLWPWRASHCACAAQLSPPAARSHRSSRRPAVETSATVCLCVSMSVCLWRNCVASHPKCDHCTCCGLTKVSTCFCEKSQTEPNQPNQTIPTENQRSSRLSGESCARSNSDDERNSANEKQTKRLSARRTIQSEEVSSKQRNTL